MQNSKLNMVVVNNDVLPVQLILFYIYRKSMIEWIITRDYKINLFVY